MLDNDDVHLLAAFAEVVRAGSLSAAARKLKRSKSSVSQQLARLEARCGARLLERSTRRLRLTEIGEQALAAAARIEAELGQLQRDIEAVRGEPTGTLRVTSTNDLAADLVAPTAAKVLAAHPGVRLDLVADDAEHDLLRDGFDLALRLGRPRDSTYVMRKLATITEPIVAAPALAARWAEATSPRALVGAPWVLHSLLDANVLVFRGPGGSEEELRPAVRAQANTGYAVRALLREGVGFGTLPEYQIRPDLAAGVLVRVCPEWIWKELTLYTLVPSKAVRPVVRVMLDAIVVACR